jgi:hypothetical protein
MTDYLFLMHNDVPKGELENPAGWEGYIARLQESGCFRGGSMIGAGHCARKAGPVPAIGAHLVGYIRVETSGIKQAEALLTGNPVFESGGTVEIRELPKDE